MTDFTGELPGQRPEAQSSVKLLAYDDMPRGLSYLFAFMLSEADLFVFFIAT